jgi:hypothetical protein
LIAKDKWIDAKLADVYFWRYFCPLFLKCSDGENQL